MKKTDKSRTAKVTDETIYVVTTNSDSTEGRGRDITIGRYFYRRAAEGAAKGAGVMGTDAKISHESAILVHLDSGVFLVGQEVNMLDETVEDREAERQRALAKLTPRERELVLGVPEKHLR